MRSSFHIGVDVGGTFTDVVLWDRVGDEAHSLKTLTTEDPAQGIFEGIDRILAAANVQGCDVERFVHATTLVANAIIERRGARTALVATTGFRDVLQIRRELRYDLFEQHLQFPDPLIPRARRLELAERMDARGNPALVPGRDDLDALLAQIEGLDVDSVAVSLINSYANPAHERLVGDLLAERAPGLAVSLSSDVLPQIKEYERTSATAINAYVQPIVARYLGELSRGLAERGCSAPVLVMTSTGGVVSHATAERLPILLVESGPAAGAIFAARLSELAGSRNVVAFDMGGTTAKVCVVEESRPQIRTDHEVARTARFRSGSGMPIGIPVFDLLEIGAGGGSIAEVDATGLVRVGPRSAAARPGPACYGLGGTEPTVTDANLVLGYLDEDALFRDRRLDRDAALRALDQHVAKPTEMDPVEAALTVYRIVTETMAEALRIRTVEANVDARGLELVSFGGAAGVHAVDLARRLGIRRVVCPSRSGVFSAAGLLAAPLAVDVSRTWIAPLGELTARAVRNRFEALRAQADDVLERAGADVARREYSADMSYVGQEFEVDVALPSLPRDRGGMERMAQWFEERYQRLRGRRLEGYEPRIVTWRVRAAADDPPLSSGFLATGGGDGDAPAGSRRVFLGGRWSEVPVFDWRGLPAGAAMAGPAVVQHTDTALVLPDRASLEVDQWRRLVVATGVEELADVA
jgi:N-methylhydantoinase A